MARRKSGGDGGGEGTWLNTYADMVTLLLTFFAVLLSMSAVDQQKFEQLIQSFQIDTSETSSMGGAGGVGEFESVVKPEEGEIQTIDELYQYLSNYVNENQKQDAVSLSSQNDIVYIRFDTDLFFRPNQYTLLPDSYPILQFIGEGLKGCEDIIRMVNISGHTADVQVETNVSDWRLSGDRAATVAMFLEDEMGFPPNKIKIEGYGDQYPIADNSTEEGRRQNRRVELVIIGEDAALTTPEIYQSLQQFYDEGLYPTEGTSGDLLVPPNGQSQASSSASSDAGQTSPDASAQPASDSAAQSAPPQEETQP